MTNPTGSDPEAFRAFEHTGWQKIVDQYDQYFTELTAQTIHPLLDVAGVRAGMRVLDVATGPGLVAAAAAARGAKVLGLDFAAGQVALARRKYPAVEFIEGDAENLTFPAGSFDAVLINFGMLHFPNPEKALAGAAHVLKSGGRVAFTVWAAPEKSVGFGLILQTIQRLGNMNVPLPPGPPFFRFSDHEECRRALRGAGFVKVEVQDVIQTWRLPSSDMLFESLLQGTVRTAALLRAQTLEAREAIRNALREAARAYQRAGRIEMPMSAVLASATKP